MKIDVSKLPKEITEKYSIDETNKFFGLVVKDNPKDLIETEIGDAKQPDIFYPQVKIKNWNNETNLSVRLKNDDYDSATVVVEDGKIKWKKQNKVRDREINKTKNYIRDKFWNKKHPKQIREVKWLIDKFKPLPGWHK